VKGIVKKSDGVDVWVNLQLYPEELARKFFGEGKRKGDYLVFSCGFGKQKAYELFNRMLEEVAG